MEVKRLTITFGVLLATTLLVASGCTSTPSTDAGCVIYGVNRAQMPRPVGTGPLAEWVAVTDAAMTGACR